MGIAKDLNFDVPRLFDKFFDEHTIVTKCIQRFGLAGSKAFMCFPVVVSHPQALAAAAGRSLDHHRVADAFGDFHRLLRPVNCFVVTGYAIDLGVVGEFFRRDLVAHGANRLMLGADKNDSGFFEPA